jgi:CheY-like chemotaxis protein
MLSDMGYTPDCALNGEEAVEMSQNEYDVIFMDIGLPGISGTEAALKIRQTEAKDKQAYIVALTGYSEKEVKEKCDAAGINIVKTKPISEDALEEIFSNLKELMSKQPLDSPVE